MKQIGQLASQLAYGAHVNKEAVAVLNECRWRCHDDLVRIGVAPSSIGELVERATERFVSMAHLCESPIEQMMLAAMSFMVVDGAECFPPAIHDVMSGEEWPNSAVVIVPQFVVARYRLDFLVVVNTGADQYLLAVECDGAEHHANATGMRNDAARDKYLRSLGIKTLRLSGKWIFRNQWKVADELLAILQEKCEAA